MGTLARMRQLDPSQRRARNVIAVGGAIAALLVIVGLAWPDRSATPWTRTGPTIGLSGWLAYWQVDAGLTSFAAQRGLFDDVSIMAYSAQGADTIVAYPGLPSYAIGDLRSAAGAAGVPVLATIFDEMPAGAMAGVLADPTTRAAHVAAILRIVQDGGFGGVDLDYERFAFSDDRGTWSATQPNWVAFLTELAAALHRDGHLLVVSVPPIYDDGSPADSGAWVYDYAAMGTIVDRIRVMAYDYSTSDPGPIAPIGWVTSLVHAIAKIVPPAKLDLGIPVYGRDWPVSTTGTCPADQTPSTTSISTVEAAAFLTSRALSPTWDADAAEMRVDYTDTLIGNDASGVATSCTVSRTLRYLDANAVQARARLAWRNDFHGVALWALGNDDAATWAGLQAARAGLEPVIAQPSQSVPGQSQPGQGVPGQSVVTSTS